MTTLRSALFLGLTLLTGASVLVGCASSTAPSTVGTARVATGGAVATSSSSAAAESPTPPATTAPSKSRVSGGSGSMSPADLDRVRGQLDAMQKEIDNLKMPSDDDFNGASGSLY